MPTTAVSRVVRVFVSSTFSDFAAERELLRTRVFRPMAEQLLARGFLLQVIDLRWGITTEAALGNRTVQICLDQVRLCQERSPRPNFVILAGDRYGWCPAPPELPKAEFRALLQASPPAVAKRLTAAYVMDANAEPPMAVLRPRPAGLGADAEWAGDEQAAARAVAAALANVPPAAIRAERREAYLQSATEREIDVGLFGSAGAEHHVFAVLRTIRGLDEAMAGPGAPRLARYVDVSQQGRWDEAAWRRERALHDRIVGHLAGTGRVFPCSCSVEGGELSTAHLQVTELRAPEAAVKGPADTLAEAVWRGLWQVLLPELEVRDAARRARRLHAGAEHAELGRDRARRCFGREDVLTELAARLQDGGGEPLVLHGPSGVGKSTVVATLAERLRRAHPGWLVVERFIGAGALADHTVALLDGLASELLPDSSAPSRPAGDPIAASASGFLRALRAPRTSPLVLLLDALDQLPSLEQERLADWLPSRLPPGVRLLVSTARSPAELPAVRDLPASRWFPLPGLDRDGGGRMLCALLSEAHRTLAADQRLRILDAFDRSHVPLWMDLVARQARRWLPGDAPELPGGPEDLVDGWFKTLAIEHGGELVAHVLGFLAASRRGLTETALWDLCSGAPAIQRQLLRTMRHVPVEYQSLAPAAGVREAPDLWLARVQRDAPALEAWAQRLVAAGVSLPQAVWIRLREDLAIYLTERDVDGMTLADFHHGLVRRVAAAQTTLADELHRRMAAYFGGRWMRGDLLALDEVAPQLAASHQAEALAELLTDPRWQVLVLRHLGVGRLESFFALARDAGLDDAARAQLASILDAITESAHTVTGVRAADSVGPDPEQLPGQLLGRLQGQHGPLLDRFLERLAAWRPERERDGAERDLLLPVTACLPAISQRLVRTIAGHARAAWWGPPPPLSAHVALSVDGRSGVSCDDWRVLVWDPESGIERQRIDVSTSDRDRGFGLTGVALAPTGEQIICCASDGALRRFDLATGSLTGEWPGTVERCAAGARAPVFVTTDQARAVQVRRWERPELFDILFRSDRPVTALAMDASSPVLALGFDDGGLAVWDLGARAQTGRGKVGGQITALALDAAREQVWWGDASGRLGAWAYRRSAPQTWAAGHHAAVAGIALLSRDRVVSVSLDASVLLWHGDGVPLGAPTAAGPIAHVASGHSHRIRGVAAHRERSIFATFSDDTTVRVWDADQPDLESPRPGHRSAVRAAAIDPLRGQALTASRDGAIALWSLEDGRSLGCLGHHVAVGGPVWSPGDPDATGVDCEHIAVAPSGQHVVSTGPGSVCWWRLDLPHACSRSTPTPTPEPWGREVVWAGDGRMLLSTSSGHVFAESGDGWTPLQFAAWDDRRPRFRPVCARRGGWLAWVPAETPLVEVGQLSGDRVEPVGVVRHEAYASAATFLPDGSALLTVGHDGYLRCWSLPSLQPLGSGVIGRHERPIWDVVVSEDGTTAVTVGDDRWLAVWDIPGRRLRCCFRAEGAMVRVAIDGAARFIATGDEAGRPIVLHRLVGGERAQP